MNELDNRSSHFYLALYWAIGLAEQTHDAELASVFVTVARELEANEDAITHDLINCQGKAMDIGGYYMPTCNLATDAMRPSRTFNAIIDGIFASV